MSPTSRPILSLAGATANPARSPIPQRIGGFGGAEGLAAFLAAERIGAVVDATHPFASRMSANAVAACRRDRYAARRLHPPALDARARRPLDRGRDHGRRGRRSRGRAENGLPHAGPAAARRLRASAAASLYRAGDRPAGGDRRAAQLQADPCARALLARRRTRAHATRADRGAGDQEQRRAARPTPRSRRRARLESKSSSCAGRPRPKPKRCHDLDAVMAWIAAHRATP